MYDRPATTSADFVAGNINMNQPTSAAITRTRNSHGRCSPNVVRKRETMYQPEPKSASDNNSRTPTRNTVFITPQRLREDRVQLFVLRRPGIDDRSLPVEIGDVVHCVHDEV